MLLHKARQFEHHRAVGKTMGLSLVKLWDSKVTARKNCGCNGVSASQ